MGRVHLVAGKNNVGKSNALRAMQGIVPNIGPVKDGPVFSEGRDNPEGWSPTELRDISLGFYRTDTVLRGLRIPSEAGTRSDAQHWLERFFSMPAYAHSDEQTIWFDFSCPPTGGASLESFALSEAQFDAAFEEMGRPYDLQYHLMALTDEFAHTERSPFERISRIVTTSAIWDHIPPVVTIEAKREIGDDSTIRTGDNPVSSYANGRGLVRSLAALESPDYDNRADRTKFDKLRAFVRTVIGDATADIRIPHTHDDILVTTNGRMESFRSLGSGIGELVLIAAAATAVTGHLICIEEPELHLHPTLQRKVLTYLANETDNHYLISTHSAQLLDSELVTISHFTTSAEGWTDASTIISGKARSRLVTDLGNRPSDLVQSNFVVWVEGPSDRIYVDHWIRTLAPDLDEQSHYSVMFYGGSLLNHLTASDEDEVIGDFIRLVTINRNFAVLIDSDRNFRTDTLNSTKTRVLAELDSAGAMGWVTDGYTIENYIPAPMLAAAVEQLYPGREYDSDVGQGRSPLGSPFDGSAVKPDKVRIAREIVRSGMAADSWPTHLRDSMTALVERIREANES
jgi:hypothetical protein